MVYEDCANKNGSFYVSSSQQFGIFSPAVLGAKKLLGEKSLNKIRGQAISLHSQVP
jgi:hypothetical protein